MSSTLLLENETMNFPLNAHHYHPQDPQEMDRLVQILSDAENIMEGGQQQTQHPEDVFVSPTMFDPVNLSALVSPAPLLPPPCASSAGFRSSAPSCGAANMMDFLEPTPIGGSIHVVEKVAPPAFAMMGCNTMMPPAPHPTVRRVSGNSIAPLVPLSGDMSHGSAIMVDMPGSPRASTIVSSSSVESFSPIQNGRKSSNSKAKKTSSKKYQDDQWNQRFQELLEFRSQHGHLLVPHGYAKNYKLSQWVKR